MKTKLDFLSNARIKTARFLWLTLPIVFDNRTQIFWFYTLKEAFTHLEHQILSKLKCLKTENLLISQPRRRFRTLAISFAVFSTLNYVYKLLLLQQLKSMSCSQICPYSSVIKNNTIEFDSLNRIRTFPEFICPQNFRNLADWIYGWPNQFDERLEMITDHEKYILSCLPSGSIIYVRIWAIDKFFNEIYPILINDFVLITGEGDISSPTHFEHLERVDSKIIHWFGQNGQYDVSKTKKFTHIPIGINCYEMADAIRNVYLETQNKLLPSIFNNTDEPSSYIQPEDVSRHALNTTIPFENLVLINYALSSDITGLRARIWKTFCRKTKQNSVNYVTCFRKPGGVQIENLLSIYKRNRQYPFWLSPRGGGLDCHRTWEALYLDIIPIVWNSSLNVLYENLPVLVINDHNELSEEFLYKKLQEISRAKLSNKNIYHYEKLRPVYWSHLILSKSRHKHNPNISQQRTHLCWKGTNAKSWIQSMTSFA